MIIQMMQKKMMFGFGTRRIIRIHMKCPHTVKEQSHHLFAIPTNYFLEKKVNSFLKHSNFFSMTFQIWINRILINLNVANFSFNYLIVMSSNFITYFTLNSSSNHFKGKHYLIWKLTWITFYCHFCSFYLSNESFLH